MISLTDITMYEPYGTGDSWGKHWDQANDGKYNEKIRRLKNYISIDGYIDEIIIEKDIHQVIRCYFDIAYFILEKGIIRFQSTWQTTRVNKLKIPKGINCDGVAFSIRCETSIVQNYLTWSNFRFSYTTREYQEPEIDKPVIPDIAGLKKCQLFMKKDGVLVPCKTGVKRVRQYNEIPEQYAWIYDTDLFKQYKADGRTFFMINGYGNTKVLIMFTTGYTNCKCSNVGYYRHETIKHYYSYFVESNKTLTYRNEISNTWDSCDSLICTDNEDLRREAEKVPGMVKW